MIRLKMTMEREAGMARLALYGLIGYGVLILFVFFGQRRMLYYPDSNLPSPSQLERMGLRSWLATGGSPRGFIAAQSPAAGAGTVVVFHGNAGTAWQRDYYVKALEPLGYRVLLAEYPGYGGRSGGLGEKVFVADSRETVRLAFEEFGGPLVLLGESLGCGVAAGVAADPPVPVAGVALLTPWDTLPNLAQTIYWFLPARWLVRDKYDNVSSLSGFPGRVAVMVASHDEVIPKRHGLALYAALGGHKRLWVVANAGHNTWPDQVDTAWWREVMGFLANR
jgi:hypothetical protein